MKKTPNAIITKHAFHIFGDYKDFEKFLQKEYKNDETIDSVAIDDVLYTMEEYDNGGVNISYYNRRTGLGFIVNTSNRYSDTRFTDAIVDEPYEVGAYRNDITFID